MAYLKWLEKKLNFRQPNDWYQVEAAHFRVNRGGHLLQKHYDGLPQRAAMCLYPNRVWYPWLFRKVPVGFWKTKSNRALYLKWLGTQLGFKTKNDWRGLLPAIVVAVCLIAAQLVNFKKRGARVYDGIQSVRVKRHGLFLGYRDRLFWMSLDAAAASRNEQFDPHQF